MSGTGRAAPRQNPTNPYTPGTAILGRRRFCAGRAGGKISGTLNHSVAIELTAVIVAVTGQEPRVLTTGAGRLLPSGPFESSHRTLQASLRSWVEQQTRHPLGYVEQLYTFADRDRTDRGAGGRVISISYLGLTTEAAAAADLSAGWRSWYRYLPWEDWRGGAPTVVMQVIRPGLRAWVMQAADAAMRQTRARRVAALFPRSIAHWNEEFALQRYELLYEAGLAAEATRQREQPGLGIGEAMLHDCRRILATGMARLRAKIKYRPVVFELLPPSFTLLQLQHAVEALAGRTLHKSNFRRLIEHLGLVEETGKITAETGGRPAKLFRFRRTIVAERDIAATRLPVARAP